MKGFKFITLCFPQSLFPLFPFSSEKWMASKTQINKRENNNKLKENSAHYYNFEVPYTQKE